MTDRRSVSIVVLAHNNLDYTRRCFELIVQNTENYEVVVVDNASTDGTVEFLHEWAESYPAFRPIFNTNNVGYASGCNRGVAVARYGTICLLNNDTEPLPGWLDPLLSVLSKGVGAVGAKLLLPDGTLQHCGIEFQRVDRPQPHFWPYHRFLYFPSEILEANVLEAVPAVTGACLLTTKTVWSKVNGMDEGYTIANFEDVDFNLKIRASGLKVLYQPESTLVHHWGVTVKSKENDQDSPGRYFEQNFDRLMNRWNASLARGLSTA